MRPYWPRPTQRDRNDGKSMIRRHSRPTFALRACWPGLPMAQSAVGNCHDRQTGGGGMGFQPAATELARDLQWLDHIAADHHHGRDLRGLRAAGCRDRALQSRAEPVPAKFTHNTPLEVAWTLVPMLILVFIGAFSLPILFRSRKCPTPMSSIKVTGYQWYWAILWRGLISSYMIGRRDRWSDCCPEKRAAPGRGGLSARMNSCWRPTLPWWCRWARTSCCRSPARRDPFLDHSGLRREAGRRAGPHRPAVVQRRTGRHLFRPVFASCAASTTPICRSP